jgi:hypothetical protein
MKNPVINRRVRILFNKQLTLEEFTEWCRSNVSHLKNNVNFQEKYQKYCLLFPVTRSDIRLSDIGFFTPSNGGITKNYLYDRGWEINEIVKYFKHKSIKEKSSISPEVKLKYGNCNRYEFYLTKINPLTNKNYTEHEAKEKVYRKQSKASNAKKVKYKSGEINVNMFSYDFWKNKGLNDIEISQKIQYLKDKIGHSMTLDGYIERYGTKEGLKRFTKRQEKWQNSLNSKSDEDKLAILIKKTKKLPFYSKQATLFFDKLIDRLKGLNLEFFWKKNEMHIWDSEHSKLYFYDFTIRELRIIIEFNGVHCHPSPYLSQIEWDTWRCVYTKQTANDKYLTDQRKLLVAKEKGFTLETVWSDSNIEEQLQLLIDKINKKYESTNQI